ncbi:hypothetical protein MMC09_004923 [Bachmanniomyces sp. S44760]|nr:hypothetical protein [Bachmanniomyces sp. S44760]
MFSLTSALCLGSLITSTVSIPLPIVVTGGGPVAGQSAVCFAQDQSSTLAPGADYIIACAQAMTTMAQQYNVAGPSMVASVGLDASQISSSTPDTFNTSSGALGRMVTTSYQPILGEPPTLCTAFVLEPAVAPLPPYLEVVMDDIWKFCISGQYSGPGSLGGSFNWQTSGDVGGWLVPGQVPDEQSLQIDEAWAATDPTQFAYLVSPALLGAGASIFS